MSKSAFAISEQRNEDCVFEMLKFASEMATHIQPNKIWLVSTSVSLPSDQGDMSLGQNLLSKTSQPIDFASFYKICIHLITTHQFVVPNLACFFKSSTKLKYDAIHIYPPQPECPGAPMDTATCGLGRAQWQPSFCCLILGILSHCQWLYRCLVWKLPGLCCCLLPSARHLSRSLPALPPAGDSPPHHWMSHSGWLNPHDTESNGFIWHIILKGLNPNYIHHYTSTLQ